MEAVDPLNGLAAMSVFDWVAAGIVVTTMIYLSFVLTLRDWFAALRRGDAVTLLPQRTGKQWPLWSQAVMVVVGIAVAIPFFYYLWIPVAAIPASIADVLAFVGLVIYCLGMALVLAARRTLGRYWGVSTSRQARLLADHELIKTGPYAMVRHPMYSGSWLLFMGLTLLYPVWAMLLMLFFSVISFASRARREETALEDRFGPEWEHYKSRTRRFVPFVW